MEHNLFCKNCLMPMEKPGDHGTEQDGSVNDIFCKYCYQKGQFINHGMTLKQMKDHLQINKLSPSQDIPEDSSGSHHASVHAPETKEVNH